MVREMDDHRTVHLKGRVVVPNVFDFTLSTTDHANFAEIEDALVRELCDAAREYAREENYSFMGPVEVNLGIDPRLKAGRFNVVSRLHETEGGKPPGALVLPSGERKVLGTEAVRIGRLPESEIPLADPNVSRNHAQVRPAGAGFEVVDLGSTNGTKVNGMTLTGPHQLVDGDEISVGAATFRFEAS